MRKVTYFRAGTVGDFVIPEDRFAEFSRHAKQDARHDTKELDRARLLLDAFMASGDEQSASPAEIAAACFVWNYFNTQSDDELYIDGDVLIIDLEGDGRHIDYAAASDVQLEPEN